MIWARLTRFLRGTGAAPSRCPSPRPPAPSYAAVAAFLSLLFLLAAGPGALAQDASAAKKEQEKQRLVERYHRLADQIQPRRLDAHLQELTRYESRVVGYEGERRAAEYVRSQLEAIFPGQVEEEQFIVSAPIDHGDSRLAVAGQTYSLQALWPNLVRTSQLPKDGLRAPLIYARTGRLADFNGKEVEDSVVLVEFNSSSDWLNAPRMGAKAVIFIEPETTMRGEAESKFLSIPVAIPRFWISKRDAAQLIPALQGPNPPTAMMKCDMHWENRPARNFLAKIAGRDPEMRDQIIVFEAYYDSMSMVPSKAPGAENACGIAAMLEIARALKQHPPKRTVWFLATSGHYIG